MRRTILFILLLQTPWATGFSQSLSLSRLGETFQRTNLDVRWEVPTNTLPHTVWIYRLLPKTFPPTAVSNLAMQCGFTEKDRRISTADQTIYKDADKFPPKQLNVSRGSIFYNAVSHYGPKNLATNVPEITQMPSLTTNFLLQFGVELSDIEKNGDGVPNFHYWEPFKEYFMPNGIVTNIEFRAVSFSRAVDGATVIGAGTAGDGEIYFGPNGKPAPR